MTAPDWVSLVEAENDRWMMLVLDRVTRKFSAHGPWPKNEAEIHVARKRRAIEAAGTRVKVWCWEEYKVREVLARQAKNKLRSAPITGTPILDDQEGESG